MEQVGKRGAMHFQNCRCLGHVEPQGLDDLGFDQLARMGRNLHGDWAHDPVCTATAYTPTGQRPEKTKRLAVNRAPPVREKLPPGFEASSPPARWPPSERRADRGSSQSGGPEQRQ